MKAYCKVILLIYITVSGVKSKVARGCDDISVSCEPSQIIVTNHNATTAFAKEILKLCNANKKCQVSNLRHECVWMEYRCNAEGTTVGITEKSHVKHFGKYSLLSLMSNGYRKGRYIEVHDTQCSLIPQEFDGNLSKRIEVVINEFAPYANSTDLCFNIEESEAQPFCSGSKKLLTIFDKWITSTTGWHFNLKVSNQIGRAQEFRFWIDITIAPNDGTTYDLECDSQRAMISINKDTIITASVLGAMLSLALLVIGIMCRFYKITKDQIVQMTDGHEYDYIDVVPSCRDCDLQSNPTASIFRNETLENANHTRREQPMSGGSASKVMTHDNTGASDYLIPRVTFGIGADETIHDQGFEREHSAWNEVNVADARWNKDDELQEEVIENEYEGLDEAAMEADNISRCSDEVLYTLMDGMPSRLPAHDEEATSGHTESADEFEENVTSADALEEKECEGTTDAFAEDNETAKGTYDDVAGHAQPKKLDPTFLRSLESLIIRRNGRME